jgi:hypothetical protein
MIGVVLLESEEAAVELPLPAFRGLELQRDQILPRLHDKVNLGLIVGPEEEHRVVEIPVMEVGPDLVEEERLEEESLLLGEHGEVTEAGQVMGGAKALELQRKAVGLARAALERYEGKSGLDEPEGDEAFAGTYRQPPVEPGFESLFDGRTITRNFLVKGNPQSWKVAGGQKAGYRNIQIRELAK